MKSNNNKQSVIDFKALFDAAPGLFLILKPDVPKFTILGASDAYLQATMTERENITGRDLFEVFPDNPDDHTATGTSNLLKSLKNVLNNKAAHKMDLQKYDIRRPQSEGGGFEERYWSPLNSPVLNENNEVEYIIHRVEDVTDFVLLKKNAAEEMKVAKAESEEKLRTQNFLLISTITSYRDILIFSVDRDYHYLVFNEAFRLATFQAYSTNVSIGASMLDSITNAKDRKKAKDNCDKALKGKEHMTLEVYGELTRYYYETRYSPIFGDDNKIIGVTVMSTNVTERKRAEEQLLELNKELESFSYSVSHDLRAPLRAIDGYAGILEEDYGKILDEEGSRLLEAVQYNARKMGNLIDDLLAFSRLGKKELAKTSLNMNELVEAALYELNKSVKHNATVKINNLSACKGDYGLINQVVINLLSNAIKYSSKVKDPFVEVSSEKMDAEIIYSVKDNGAGFDMRYADKLFGVFQRLHTMDEFEGTGVGLAIVQRIMSKHGGKVFATGEKDKGAVFKFSLPIN